MLEFRGYFAEIQFSAVDDVFYGKVLGIKDLVLFEGSTVKKLKRAFSESINDYLSTCKKLGKTP